MNTSYYKLPLRLSALLDQDQGKLAQCDELESIDQNIEMLLTTCPGEHHYDQNFGSRIWDLDFERVVSRVHWEEQFTTYIRDAISAYEPRLRDVTVTIDMREVVKEERLTDSVTIRKRVDIYVTAVRVSTSQKCRLGYTLYLGPLSNE